MLQQFFEQMALIRCLEENILKLFEQGRIYGTTHTCIGQEAVAVALGANLTGDDYIFCPHRCHGHFIANGGSPEALIAELMGRITGICAGRGGSQHLHFKRFFSNGIQGGVVGNATGAALALKLSGENGIAVAVLGDGTLGEGLVYESLNFAALKELPILFVVEDNGYAQTTPAGSAVSGSMTDRARAFGIETDETDSSDVSELCEVFWNRIDYVRTNSRPFFQVVRTYRLAAHSKGDDTRAKEEVAQHWKQDPLLVNGLKLDAAERAAIFAKVEQQIAEAICAAEQAEVTAAGSVVFMDQQDNIEQNAAPVSSHGDTFVRALNRGLFSLMEREHSTFLMGEDILDPYGGAFGVSKGLSTAFPERVIPSPISEAGLVAWGVGAALAGLKPIVEIMFGDFLALAADQILNHAAKYRWISNERVTVPLIIRTPMGGGRGYGPTHSQSIEKMFLGIPGLQVVAPNRLLDPGELLCRCVAHGKNPTLFIEHKLLYPQPLYSIKNGRIGNFYLRFSGALFPTAYLSLTEFEKPDVCIIAYGGMATMALEAAERLLLEHEIAATIIIPTLLYPFSIGEILPYADGVPLVATVEEGQGFAGWGAEIVAGLVENTSGSNASFLRITAAASPLPASLLLEKSVLPSVDGIINAVLRKLK